MEAEVLRSVRQRGQTRFTTRYIPIEEGADVQLGNAGLRGVTGHHVILGYQPAPLNPRARKTYQPHGWLVVLVDEQLPDEPGVARPRRLRAVYGSKAGA